MASASHVSPSSSPRLPSPPPMAEDQVGPKSPQIATADDQGGFGAFGNPSQGASRRIRPGTKAADMTEGPPLTDLVDIDSAFQLTEHLKALHNSYTHPPHQDHTIPVDHETALRLAQAPDGIDRALWLYELCRFLVQKVNSIIIALFADDPPCSAQTCPEMRASEWQYLCAVHDPPKSCCAIDYCCHTLDWAANTLSSSKHFPSRLALGTDTTNPQNQVRQLTNIFRRVYRIFAHAWFQHREIFWRVEGRSGLYMFLKTVCDAYNLIPEDNYTIPPEAEGLETSENVSDMHEAHISIKKNDEDKQQAENDNLEPSGSLPQLSSASTTRRHRQSASKGASYVSTVIEENEEEDDVKSEITTTAETNEPNLQTANEENGNARLKETEDLPKDTDPNTIPNSQQESKHDQSLDSLNSAENLAPDTAEMTEGESVETIPAHEVAASAETSADIAAADAGD